MRGMGCSSRLSCVDVRAMITRQPSRSESAKLAKADAPQSMKGTVGSDRASFLCGAVGSTLLHCVLLLLLTQHERALSASLRGVPGGGASHGLFIEYVASRPSTMGSEVTALPDLDLHAVEPSAELSSPSDDRSTEEPASDGGEAQADPPSEAGKGASPDGQSIGLDKQAAAQNGDAEEQYLAALRAAVLATWSKHNAGPRPKGCQVLIEQTPGGAVISARTIGCTDPGTTAASLEASVLMAQPLPYVGHERVFKSQRVVEF